MKKRLTILAVVLLLMTSLTITGYAQPSQDARERKMQNMSRAEEMNWFGRFDLKEDRVEGRFVTFDYDNANGTISDFQIFTGDSFIQIFDQVVLEDFDHVETYVSGAVFMMNGTEVRVTIHNNPRTIIQVSNPYSDVPFKVDYMVNGDIDITETASSRPYSIKYRLTMDDIEGVINTPLNATLDDNVITVDGQGHHETAHSLFMNKPNYTGEEDGRQQQIQDGIAEERIGAELDIVGEGEGNISHQVKYRESLHMRIIFMEQQRLRIRIQSEEPNGTCIMLRIEKQSLDLEIDQIRLEVDGEKAEKTSLEEVLETGEDVKYNIQEREDGILEIIVNMPYFSEREITIEAESRLSRYTLPILIIIVLAMILVILSIKRRK